MGMTKPSKRNFICYITLFFCVCTLFMFVISVKHYPIWWWFMPKARRLCDGYSTTTDENVLNLKCYYIWRSVLYRYKIEELHRGPDLITIHEFLHRVSDYDWLVQHSKEYSESSPVYTLLTNSEFERTIMRNLDFRTSNSIGYGSMYLEELFEKAGRVAGLSERNLDGGLDIVWYRPFGHIIPHHDVYPNSDTIGGGRRFATLIIYFNEPESGGATIFPGLGLAVTPKTGDAILWYNTKIDNEADPLLSHAGCPVWKGEKIIGTFWFRQYQNEFLKKCPLSGQRFSYS